MAQDCQWVVFPVHGWLMRKAYSQVWNGVPNMLGEISFVYHDTRDLVKTRRLYVRPFTSRGAVFY